MTKHLKSVHVIHEKHTAGHSTETMTIPDTVYISMSQHIGAPCKPLVKKGDYVKVGQIIGDTDAFVSAPIHSSVSGTVKEITTIKSMMGGDDQVIVIETDGKQEISEEVVPPKVETREDFVKSVRDSGLVGLGGASFPSHVKMQPKNLGDVDTLIVNGAECEPYITSDHRLMLEETSYIIDGVLEVMEHLDISKCFIGIESNKMDAIDKLNEEIKERGCDDKIKVHVLLSTYPQGAERVLIYECTGQTIKAGVLPADMGIILSNIGTIAYIAKYIETGMPLTAKRVTVSGNAVADPKNIVVPIGAQVIDVINACGGYRSDPKKILMGGPMMGRAIFSDRLPIVKNNNAILAFDSKYAVIPEETPCMKCGKCIMACPLELLPVHLSDAYEQRDIKRLEELRVMQCMECGGCSYTCPARRHLGFNNKMAKELVKEAHSNDE